MKRFDPLRIQSPPLRTALRYAYFAAPLAAVGDLAAGFETRSEAVAAPAGFLLAAVAMMLLYQSGVFQ